MKGEGLSKLTVHAVVHGMQSNVRHHDTIMKITLRLICILGLTVLIGHPVNAQVLFSDDFNSENGGTGAPNYAAFANWTVTRGAVDLIPYGGYFDFFPGNGLYVDTSGSIGAAGTITTKQSFSFVSGVTYVLSFDLAGDARDGAAKSVIVTVGTNGSILSTNITLPASAPLTLFSCPFTVTTPTNGSLSFAAGQGGDIGLILDNVQLNAGALSPPVFTSVGIANGTNCVASGTNGLVVGGYYVLASTNLMLPRPQWAIIATNQFDSLGHFAFTNHIKPNLPQQFYSILAY